MNESELQAIERHVEFSFRQVRSMADLIQNRKQDHIAGKLANGEWSAYVESFAIHTRLLYWFFYKPPKHRDDVVAGYFVPDWDGRRPPASQDLTTWATERANKQIAHMTKSRLAYAPPDYDWPVGKIANELAACCQGFIDLCRQQGRGFDNSLAPPTRVSGWPNNLTGRTT